MKIEDKLFLVRFQPDRQSHLKITDNDVCRLKCAMKPCNYICPAKVYEWDDEDQKIILAYEGCLECGTCLYGCPYDNIDWKNPRGGFGVMYKYG